MLASSLRLISSIQSFSDRGALSSKNSKFKAMNRCSQMTGLRSQLLRKSDHKATAFVSRLFSQGTHHRPRSARFFTSQPNKEIPLFESLGVRIDQLIQDAHWLIPRKGTGTHDF